MSFAAIAPREVVERKPAHGAPCNQCGLCCMVSLCSLGRRLFGYEKGRCPALQQEPAGTFVCGLVKMPWLFSGPPRPWDPGVEHLSRLTDAALHLIGAGDGCDCRINGEPVNEAFRARLDQIEIEQRERTAQAGRVWGVEIRERGK